MERQEEEEEEAPIEIDTDMDVPIAVEFNRMKKLKPKRKAKAEKKAAVDDQGEGFSKNSSGDNESEFPPGITVSLFDDSVEKHFEAVDTISKLCGETDTGDDFDPAEIRRLSSSITFLREWRQFNYPSRNLRFASQNESKDGGDFLGGVNLPQFSSATVPKKDVENGDSTSSESSKDFVMYAGGAVWALDWCPRADLHSNSNIRSEFIAVAAHPPDSSYHKIGAPLMGRGVVQIWGVLCTNAKKGMPSQVHRKRKRTSKNSETVIMESSKQRRPRGRPRKQPVNESSNNINCPGQKMQTPAVRCLEDSSALVSIDMASDNTSDHETARIKSSKVRKPRGRPRKQPVNNSQIVQNPTAEDSSSTLLTVNLDSGSTCDHVPEENFQFMHEVSNRKSADKSNFVTSKCRRPKDKARTRVQIPKNGLPLCIIDEEAEFTSSNSSTVANLGLDTMKSVLGSAKCSIPSNVALPRMVLCLAHNGKVAWDVKWRPSDVCDKQRMGYLAVLLGNGALEVWEVPFPRAMKGMYLASQKEGTDPRFIKLEPVFRCSTIKCGDRQSIPLTLEWSTSSPHDMILAGCHDGVVALWKFSGTSSLQETRPLLCFSADTVPIRALSWAPVTRMLDFLPSVLNNWRSLKEQTYKTRSDGSLLLKYVVTCFCEKSVNESDDNRINGQNNSQNDFLEVQNQVAISYSESANIIVTAGHKGLKFWDLRDPFHPLWDFYPFQRIIYSLDWLTDPSCIIVSFDDGALRILSLLKAAYDVPVTGKSFVGTQQQGFHSYLCSPFPIWSVHTSQLTGMVAYCGADGTALRFQLTTRAVDKDPLRNRAPHFLCGSLTEEDSTLTMFTPLPNTPFPMKKSLHEWAEAPRTVRGFVSVSNQEKRAKEKRAKVQPSDEKRPALCYGGGVGLEVGPDGSMVVAKSRKTAKMKTSNKKKSTANQQALILADNNPEIMQRVRGEEGDLEEVEVFPSKTVAMHRVRWNINKGSENWLCYGGAAGVLRCQEIDMFGL